MSKRQFTEAEAQRIFARAAQRQHDAHPRGVLSLEDLQAVGLEAGIDPQHIAAAISEVDVQPEKTWLGIPIRSRTVRHLDSPVTDAGWGRMVEHLRSEMPLPDVIEEIGDRLIWTSNPGMPGYGTRVSVAPEGEGAVVTVESARGQEPIMAALLGFTGAFLGGLGLLVGFEKGKTGGFWFALAVLVVTIVSVALSVWSARRKALTRPVETDRLADDLARLAGTSSSSSVSASVLEDETAPVTDRLDPDALSDALEDGTQRPRGRVRS